MSANEKMGWCGKRELRKPPIRGRISYVQPAQDERHLVGRLTLKEQRSIEPPTVAGRPCVPIDFAQQCLAAFAIWLAQYLDCEGAPAGTARGLENKAKSE